MLMPDSGASNAMNVATRSATMTPVNGAERFWLDEESTTSMVTKEIVASAANAAVYPSGPGAVETKLTAGSAIHGAKANDARPIPAIAPTNWAPTYAAASRPVI